MVAVGIYLMSEVTWPSYIVDPFYTRIVYT